MPVQLGARREHSFEEPLGLLSDCHRRIETFLGMQRRVAREAGPGTLNAEQRRAAEAALTYFATAAPRHTADEEESLFPLLRRAGARGTEATRSAIQGLESDHLAAAAWHAEVHTLFRQWLDSGALSPPQRTRLNALLDDLERTYVDHIKLEDTQLFPLAAETLSPEELTILGQEMAARRGVTPVPHHPPAGTIPMTTRERIDVRPISGPQRHPLIFRTFESLHVGEALELVNDHDPFPLRNQFKQIKAGEFDWEYVQQGPDLWRVRIGRIAPAPPQA